MPDGFVAAIAEELDDAVVTLGSRIREAIEVIYEEPSDNIPIAVVVLEESDSDDDDDASDGPFSDDGMGIFLDTALI